MAQLQSTGITGSLTVTTGSATELLVTNTGVRIGNVVSDTHTVTGSLNISGSLGTVGTITATTLVVQTITSSVATVTGSTKFGATVDNTHQFTGSILQSGSLAYFAGSVGIGSASPGYKLDVQGNAGGVTIYTNGAISSGTEFIAGSGVFASNSSGTDVVIRAGATTLMTLKTSGNVGIGTTSPNYKLHVVGTSYISDTLIVDGGGNTLTLRKGAGTAALAFAGTSDQASFLIEGVAGGGMQLYTSAGGTLGTPGWTSRLYVSSSGNVGIGVTNPSAILQLGAGSYNATNTSYNSFHAGSFGVLFRNAYDSYITFNTVYTAAGWVNKYSSYKSGIIHMNDGALSIETGTGTTAGAASSLSTKLVMTNDGNVGIGTTTPLYRLDVWNTSGIAASFRSANNGFSAVRFTSNNATVTGSITTFNDGVLFGTENVGGTGTQGQIEVKSNNNVILGFGLGSFAGNVGIGTATPTLARLQVQGNVSASSFTGSLLGTASRADNATSASFATNAVSASFTSTAVSTSFATTAVSSSFSSTVAGGTANYIPYWSATNTLGNSIMYQNGGAIGINTTAPTGSNMSSLLHVAGGAAVLRVGPWFVSDDRDFIELIANGTDTKVTSPNERFWIENRSGAIIISASANVGIGTTAPAVTLQVDASGGGLIRATRIGAGSGYLQMESDGTNGSLTANNTLYFNAGGSTRMTVLSGGSVGIGTTSPGAKLELRGLQSATKNALLLLSKFDYGTSTFYQNYGNTYFANGKSLEIEVETYPLLHLAVNNAGNAGIVNFPSGSVGIGSTAPAYKLDVVGDIRSNAGIYSGGLIQFTAGWSASPYNGSSWLRAASGVGLFLVNNGITKWAGFKPNDDFEINGGALFISSSNGNVGIGSTSPAYKLDVVGEARITGSVIGNQGGLVVGGGFGTTTLSNTQNITAGAVIGTYFGAYAFIDLATRDSNGGWIDFSSGSGDDYQGRIRYNNGSQRMDFYTNGSGTPLVSYTSTNVGIGTTSIDTKLHVYNGSAGTISSYESTGITIENSGRGALQFLTPANSDAYILFGAPHASGLTANRAYVGYDHATDIMYLFSTGRYTFSGGNVGIGSTSPAYKLDVVGNGRFAFNSGQPALDIRASDTNFALMSILGNQTGDVNWLLMSGYPNAGDFTIRQSDVVNAITIKKTSGNVGIGTTLPSTLVQAFNSTNDIATFSSRWFTSSYYSQLEIRNYSSNLNITENPQFRISHNFNDNLSNGYIGFHRGGSLSGGFLSFGTNGSEKIRIDGNGNVGIGTVSPNFKLETIGTTRISGNLSVGTTYNGFAANIEGIVYIINGSAWVNDGYGYANASATNTGMFPDSGNNITFKTNNSTRIYVTSGGNVGINSTSPAYRLDTVGDIRLSGRQLINGLTTLAYKIRHNEFSLSNGGTITDADASDGAAIYMNSASGSTFFFGPYVSITPGEYVASFRMKIASNSSTSALGTIDIIGTNTTGSSFVITPSMFETSNRYQYIDIPFTVNGSSANVEFRGVGFQSGITTTYLDHAIVRPLAKGYTQLIPENKTYNIYYTGASTPRLTINTSGNVGIGTTSPAYTLDVAGTGRFTGGLSVNTGANTQVIGSDGTYGGAYPMYSLTGVSNGYHRIFAGTADDMYFAAATSRGFRFRANGGTSDNFVILSGGNVGIGTTNPLWALDVRGISAATSLFTGNQGLNVSSYGFLSQTLSGQMTILGHNIRASDSVNNQVNVVNGSWISSMIKMYYNDGITFHTSGSMLSAGAVYSMTASERMRITSDGSIGIGTTSPGRQLEVYSTSNDPTIRTRTGGAGAWFEAWDNTSYYAGVKHIGNNGARYWISGMSQGVENYCIAMSSDGSSNRFFTINTSGNVGINTTSPGPRLDVIGNARIGQTSNNATDAVLDVTSGGSGNNAYVDFGYWGTFDASIFRVGMFGTAGNAFKIQDTGGGPAVDRIVSAGGSLTFPTSNVGIGTTTPSAQLHINSTVSNTSAPTLFLAQVDGSSQNYGQINTGDYWHGLILRGIPSGYTNYGVTAGDQMSFYEYGADFRFYKKNVSELTLQGRLNNGTWTVTGDIVAYGSPSDITLKTNIKPIQGALETVSKLQGVSFTWKEDTDTNNMVGIKDDLGFIAQDVQEVLPDLVRKNDNGLLSLRDKGIIPLLVESIKELKAEIEELKRNK